MLSGCSGLVQTDPLATSSAPEPSCATPGAMTAAVELPAGLIPGLTLDTLADEALQVHLSSPVVPGLPELNESLRAEVGAELGAYRSQVRSGSGGGELNVSWSLIGVSPQAVGVLLRIQRSEPERTIRRVSVRWYDRIGSRLVAPENLFEGTGWDALRDRLVQDLCAGDRLESADFDRRAADGTVSIAFAADGGAVVMVSHQEPGRDVSRVVLAARELSPWLSAAGRNAQHAATDPQPLLPPVVAAEPIEPVRPPVPVKKPATGKAHARKAPRERKPRVDCARKRCVALTFDDGPGPYTEALVHTLLGAGAPATFFMIGEHVDTFPETARRVGAAGFEIGNHSYSHSDLTRLSSAEIDGQLTRTNLAILRATGRRPTLLRPPYGARDRRVDRIAARSGLGEVLWDVDTLDWKHRDPASVRRAVRRDVRRGSIVLLHDIQPTTVQAVPKLITQLRRRHYTLVTVSELIGKPEPGSLHFHAG